MLYQSFTFQNGLIFVRWFIGMFEEEGAEQLKTELVAKLNEKEEGDAIMFDFSQTPIVINTAFNLLKEICQLALEKGREVIFVNPSPAMSDFLAISGIEYKIQDTAPI